MHPVGPGLEQRGFGGEQQFRDHDEPDVREGGADRADAVGVALPGGFEVVGDGSGLQGGDGEGAHGDQLSLTVSAATALRPSRKKRGNRVATTSVTTAPSAMDPAPSRKTPPMPPKEVEP